MVLCSPAGATAAPAGPALTPSAVTPADDASALCNGMAQCSADGYSTYGYAANMDTSYWDMTAGVDQPR